MPARLVVVSAIALLHATAARAQEPDPSDPFARYLTAYTGDWVEVRPAVRQQDAPCTGDKVEVERTATRITCGRAVTPPGTAPATLELEFYDDGTLRSLTMRVDGKRHGLFAEWSTTGKVLTHGRYEHDARTGVWLEWDGSTRRVLEGLYLHGQRAGEWKIWRERKQVVPDYVATFDRGRPVAVDQTTHRFGWLTSGTELALVGVAVFGHYADQPVVKWSAAGGFLVAGPLIHIAERSRRWPQSLWARLAGGLAGMTVVGIYSLGDALVQCADDDVCEEGGASADWKWSWNAVLLLGGVSTAIFDYTISYRSSSVPVSTLFPDLTVTPIPRGGVIHLSGRF